MRSEQLRRAVASLPCAKCGIEGYSQAAHANAYKWGKSHGKKASDAAIFPLCCTRPDEVGCHVRHDQYIDVKKDDCYEVEAVYIATTYQALMERELLKVAK